MCAPDVTVHWSDMKRTVRRWTALRKEALVDAVLAGHLDRREMLAQHGISDDEFDSWIAKRHAGRDALKVTRLQRYPEARS